MRLQTGVRVEAEVWQAYKAVCSREKLLPSRPIEEFLRLVVDGDSALGLLTLMREAAKSRVDGYEAYVRVLLDWYLHGKFWLNPSDDNEVSVESLLLEGLKIVVDVDLRRQIEEALIAHHRGVYKKSTAEKAED